MRAQPLDWPSLPYDYVAQGESLRDVLANFGANYDASVIVSDKVNDQVSGRFDLESPQAFLQLMASLYNLGWYYDGTVLYVFQGRGRICSARGRTDRPGHRFHFLPGAWRVAFRPPRKLCRKYQGKGQPNTLDSIICPVSTRLRPALRRAVE